MTRLIVIRGPFTDSEIAEIIAVVSAIEARRPDETFELAMDADGSADDVQELLDMVNPLRPGYERVVKTWRRK